MYISINLSNWYTINCWVLFHSRFYKTYTTPVYKVSDLSISTALWRCADSDEGVHLKGIRKCRPSISESFVKFSVCPFCSILFQVRVIFFRNTKAHKQKRSIKAISNLLFAHRCILDQATKIWSLLAKKKENKQTKNQNLFNSIFLGGLIKKIILTSEFFLYLFK